MVYEERRWEVAGTERVTTYFNELRGQGKQGVLGQISLCKIKDIKTGATKFAIISSINIAKDAWRHYLVYVDESHTAAKTAYSGEIGSAQVRTMPQKIKDYYRKYLSEDYYRKYLRGFFEERD